MNDVFVVEGSETAGHVDDLVPESIAALAVGALGSREDVEAEIDMMVAAIRQFWSLEPDEVMRYVAAFTARCAELEIQLHRAEGRSRQYNKIRTMQVGKLLDELDRQFRTASRQVELRRQDLEHLRGMA